MVRMFFWYFYKQTCIWFYPDFFFYLTSSDNEEDGVSQNGRPPKSEFKDEEETVTPKSAQVMQAAEASSANTRKRGGLPSKTVDLGAAAHYTGDKSSPDADNTKVVYIRFTSPEMLRNEINQSHMRFYDHTAYILYIHRAAWNIRHGISTRFICPILPPCGRGFFLFSFLLFLDTRQSVFQWRAFRFACSGLRNNSASTFR